MDTKKLEMWAKLLLDTGKRNNLVNFKDTKASTVEVVLPEISSVFQKLENETTFEVYDPKLTEEEDEDYNNKISEENEGEQEEALKRMKREEYINRYASRIRKSNQLLLYNGNTNPLHVLKNIEKKARAHIEETGVGVVYMAFGFVHWKETDDSKYTYKAPILLAPIILKNESSVSSWEIKMTTDDMVVNPTFRFKLESEQGITLPEYDEEGLSVYVEKVREFVSKLGWTVTTECKIGIFSFLKMNMYQDIKENLEMIKNNNNVRMLLGESFERQTVSIERGEHHLENPLIELHNVVDADSSQIEAVEMAKSGVSFVLQGPPGTGKSQTITNIIAECLYDGKKVLFVSEKQAALNIVYERLKQAGLDEFCLELHSHKANKKDVISELCHTLRTSKTAVSKSAVQEIETKKKKQKELDEYEAELHRPREVIHKTLYQLYDAYAACRTAPKLKYMIRDIGHKGEEYLKDTMDLLRQYIDFVPSIGYQYKGNPWYGYINQDTSYQNKEHVRDALIQVLGALEEFESLQYELQKAYEINCNSLSQAVLWERFFALAAESTVLTPAFLERKECCRLLEELQALGNLAESINTIRLALDAEYDEGIYQINGEEYYKKLTRQFTNIFTRIFNGEYRQIVNNVRLCNKKGKKEKYSALTALMEKLADFQTKSMQFAENENSIKPSMGSGYAGVASDWSTMIGEVQKLKELFEEGIEFGGLALRSENDFEKSKSIFYNISKGLAAFLEKMSLYGKCLLPCFDKDIFDLEQEIFPKVKMKLQWCLDSFDRIDNWCNFNQLLGKLKKKEVLAFIDMTIDHNIAADDIIVVYQRNFYYQWIDYILHLTPSMASFNRILHDKTVDDFKKEDETQFAISKAQIRSELSSHKPTLDLIASGSAVSVLLREGEKKRKQKSIRTLLEETGELVQVLKPCFLMSPLSVSTFLSADAVCFDVIVFDEASQIFPLDAVGAIYRGKQMIIVGDSKQMPPSNFFNASADVDDSDEETGDVADFESILDLCSAVLPQLRLKWHYRSRFEQLITFSNKNFYDNALITFPSAKADKRWQGVDYYYADGIYDRKAHNNRKEAEFIVDLIYKNIELYPNRSLGVVAFSISQQDLIERLLAKRRAADSSKEYFFRKDAAEPFFVKNLETVQGDERDTIIFSVAYAKDSTGRLLHNFGPLNRVGGERRLNVAVTRAKMNVQLVSSMHHTDIDLKRTQSEGVKLLKEYLDYAENGSIALERALTVNPFEQFDSEFEMEVCDFLKEKGFSVDTQVGCSGFRIDLGLKRPESSDYVLAIECDGATYHSSKNARDRDRLRQQVLEGMGWKFYRIWSTDWFKNNTVEKERLLKAASEAIRYSEIMSVDTAHKNTAILEDEAELFEEIVVEKPFSFPVYQEADIYEITTFIHNFQSVVSEILKIEAPLSEEWLLKRISWMFGREKVTSVVQREYETRMYGCSRNGIIRRNGFLYRQDQDDYVLRVPGMGEKRDIKYIAREELAAGLLTIVEQNITADKDGMYRYLTNELGFSRVGEAIYYRLEDALDLLDSFVDIQDNMVSLKK